MPPFEKAGRVRLFQIGHKTRGQSELGVELFGVGSVERCDHLALRLLEDKELLR